jgi:hypothetical protein
MYVCPHRKNDWFVGVSDRQATNTAKFVVGKRTRFYLIVHVRLIRG